MKFAQTTAELGAGRVSFWTGGEGPPVLYLHPAAGWRLSPPIERLAREYRVVAPLVPGFDGTPFLPSVDSVGDIARLYAEFVDREIGEACDVVGQSLGAWIAARMAIDHGEKLGRLVLASPAGFRGPDFPPLSFDPKIMLKQLYAYPEKRPPETKSEEQLAGNRTAVGHYGIGLAWDPELNDRIGEIEALTLIVHGTLDERVPMGAVQNLRARIAGSNLIYIYDAAHSIEIDQPERVGAVYADFLARGEAFIVNPGSPAREGTAA